MSLAPYVRAMGRGPGRARSLERHEAREAMRLILEGRAAPEAVGALLMLMRYRGETAGEIAGFVEAMREGTGAWGDTGAAVDWPSYAAGRTRGLPWFLLSARLVAQAGHPVLIHGWNSHQGVVADVRAALAAVGIATVSGPGQTREVLAREGVAYLPLEIIDPRLLGLLRLREVLGLRSAVNTALRALNPSGARVSVQGVFHPPYRALQRDAAVLLGQPEMMVLKGAGGEFERNPAKSVDLFRIAGGAPLDATAPALLGETRRLADPNAEAGHLASFWSGERDDPFAEATVTGTAALALLAAGAAAELGDAEELAGALWRDRHRASAA